MRRRGLFLASLTALLLASAAPSAENPTLTATVGPGFTISLTGPDGKAVTKLDPGTYTIEVDDRADSHNFVLTGPGVERFTDVDFVGKQTWTVTLREGRYRFFCAPHSSHMNGAFVAGNPPASTPPVTTQQPKAVSLAAVVGPGRTIAVRTAKGAKLKRIKAGRVTLAVRDRSRTLNFRLRGPGINRATSKKFRGTVRWKLTLRKGVYRYQSDSGRLRGTFRVV